MTIDCLRLKRRLGDTGIWVSTKIQTGAIQGAVEDMEIRTIPGVRAFHIVFDGGAAADYMIAEDGLQYFPKPELG